MRPYLKSVSQDEAELYIYGDIEDHKWLKSDVTSYEVAEQLKEIAAGEIRVYINSYGGSVAAGLAIYSALKRHKAKIKTYCDGFACSIASVIFMAGEERVMSNASLLMIHDPWMYTRGNAQELRKSAEDLDKIGEAALGAYMERASISEEEVRRLLAAETWITPAEALDYGFATSVTSSRTQAKYAQSIGKKVAEKILESAGKLQIAPAQEEPGEDPGEKPEDGPEIKEGSRKALKVMGAFLNAFNKKEEGNEE